MYLPDIGTDHWSSVFCTKRSSYPSQMDLHQILKYKKGKFHGKVFSETLLLKSIYVFIEIDLQCIKWSYQNHG